MSAVRLALVSGDRSGGMIQLTETASLPFGSIMTLVSDPRRAGRVRAGSGSAVRFGRQSVKRALILASMAATSKSPTAITVVRSGR